MASRPQMPFPEPQSIDVPQHERDAMIAAGILSSRRFRLWLCLALALVLLPGCAGWRPWRNKEKAALLAQKYGPNANQRIATLRADAKVAQAAAGDRQVVFTRDLAQQLLEEHDPRVRSEMLGIAATFDTPASVSILRGSLQDPDAGVRTTACDVWGKRGGAEAVQLLAQRYKTDSELDVRLRAVRMLGQLKDKEAIPVLAKALEDPDPAVQYRAVASLKQVSGRDLGDDVNKWRAWAADPEADKGQWSVAETFRKIF